MGIIQNNKELIDKKVKILNMKGELEYTNKIGIIQRIDDLGQLHGTWGSLALIPGVDDFIIIEDKKQ